MGAAIDLPTNSLYLDILFRVRSKYELLFPICTSLLSEYFEIEVDSMTQSANFAIWFMFAVYGGEMTTGNNYVNHLSLLL